MSVVFFGIYYGATRGSFIGFVTGLCMDALTGTQLGPYIIIYILCGGLAGLLVKKVYSQHFLTFLASVSIGSFIEVVILFFWNEHIGLWIYLFQLAGGSFLYNAVVAIPFCIILNKLFNPDTVKFAILKTQRS
jgi:rod shape-determining protein MreD